MAGEGFQADTAELEALKQKIVKIGTTTNNVASNVRTARREANSSCRGYDSALKALSRVEEAWVVESGLHSSRALDLAAAIRDFAAMVDYVNSAGAAELDMFFGP